MKRHGRVNAIFEKGRCSVQVTKNRCKGPAKKSECENLGHNGQSKRNKKKRCRGQDKVNGSGGCHTARKNET